MTKNKLDYEAAKKRLKEEEKAVRIQKLLLKRAKDSDLQRYIQGNIRKKRDTINLLLSVIHAHKSARKLYAQVANW